MFRTGLMDLAWQQLARNGEAALGLSASEAAGVTGTGMG